MSQVPPREGLVVGEGLPVDLASVDTALTTIWKRQEPTPGSSQGVMTRACMSNLIIVCAGRAEAETVTREVDEIVARHPSRVLLLVAEAAGPSAAVSAAVSAHCHLTGEHRKVCSEMVAIGASGDEVRKLPSAARSLLIGDLPTSLWWDAPVPPPLAGDLFDELRPMADQVLYSSEPWSDPVRGTLAVADWVFHSGPGDPIAVDLTWRSLRPWRQLISQALDPLAIPGAAVSLRQVEIEHGRHGLPQAWLLAGWFAAALGWAPAERNVVKGHEVSWRFRDEGRDVSLVVRRVDSGEAQVQRVTVAWQADGRRAALTFAPAGSCHLAATPEGFNAATRVLAFPCATRAGLVAAELQQLEPDQVFREALGVSRRLAEHLVLG